MNRPKIVIAAFALAACVSTAFAQSAPTRRTLGPALTSGATATITPPPPPVIGPVDHREVTVAELPVAATPGQPQVEVIAAKPQPAIPAKNQVAAASDQNAGGTTAKNVQTPDKTVASNPPGKSVANPTAAPDRTIAAIDVTAPAIMEIDTPYAKEIARLQAIAPAPIPLRNVPLSTVIRAIALHSSMNYLAPNEDEFAEVVTLRYSGNPWQLLSILKRRHNFEMTFEDGIWSFYRTNPAELISRTYHLRYNNNVSVKSSGNNSAALAQSTNSSGGNGGGSTSQQAQTGGRGNIFESSGEQIVKDLKTLLGIPITGVDATIAAGGVVGELTPIAGGGNSHVAGKLDTPKSDVIFLPDSNSLFVVAPRQQHQYVEEFLKAADKPQPLIRIDAKLIETNRDPRSFIGIDPSGYARPTVSLTDVSSSVGGDSSSTTGTDSQSSGGKLTTPPFDLGNLRTLRAPNAAVLSMSDISFQLNLLKQDAQSRVTNEPNLVTTNNREVAIESVIEEPYASSSTNNAFQGTAGSSGQTTTQLDRIKIGTVINVLPQIMRGENGQRYVYLNLELTVSGKVGDKLVFGQLVPITSSRSYRYSIAVPDGYTLAIGGLDETSISEAENKIPLAGDIPVVGYIFKSKTAANTRRNLIAYITPTILDFPGSLGVERAAYQPIPVDTGVVGKGKDKAKR